MSVFAQNNGVIVLTKVSERDRLSDPAVCADLIQFRPIQCANRRAGFTCAAFLILYGILGKISGVFVAIPNPVLVSAKASDQPIETVADGMNWYRVE